MQEEISSKNQTTAILLAIFLGEFGAHRFYCGKIGTGILWLLTCGCFGIGWIIDIVILAMGKFTDNSGAYLRNSEKRNYNEQPSPNYTVLPETILSTERTSKRPAAVIASQSLSDGSVCEKIEASKLTPTTQDSTRILQGWYISVSFGKSTSQNYLKAVTLAKTAPQYHEQEDNGHILHQAFYSSAPNEFLAFIMLYELVGGWKSSFVMINGELVDRKIVGKLNYCYGDKCRSNNPHFCYGASYMTENPFGCHRLQISACNNPWWSFYSKRGNKFVLDKASMLQKINATAETFHFCPCFNYGVIKNELDRLPEVLNMHQLEALKRNNFGLRM